MSFNLIQLRTVIQYRQVDFDELGTYGRQVPPKENGNLEMRSHHLLQRDQARQKWKPQH